MITETMPAPSEDGAMSEEFSSILSGITQDKVFVPVDKRCAKPMTTHQCIRKCVLARGHLGDCECKLIADARIWNC